MKIDVYDSFATSEAGELMHFDVFVQSGTVPEKALNYGRQWLLSIGENPESLTQSRCTFCHTESAKPEIKAQVIKKGHFILQMEGCPSPYLLT